MVRVCGCHGSESGRTVRAGGDHWRERSGPGGRGRSLVCVPPRPPCARPPQFLPPTDRKGGSPRGPGWQTWLGPGGLGAKQQPAYSPLGLAGGPPEGVAPASGIALGSCWGVLLLRRDGDGVALRWRTAGGRCGGPRTPRQRHPGQWTRSGTTELRGGPGGAPTLPSSSPDSGTCKGCHARGRSPRQVQLSG